MHACANDIQSAARRAPPIDIEARFPHALIFAQGAEKIRDNKSALRWHMPYASRQAADMNSFVSRAARRQCEFSVRPIVALCQRFASLKCLGLFPYQRRAYHVILLLRSLSYLLEDIITLREAALLPA